MAGIVISRSVCAGGNHHTLTIQRDGGIDVIPLDTDQANTPLTDDDWRTLHRLMLRVRRTVNGVSLADMLNRVTHGDEANNVRFYPLVAPGSAVTKTNIGTAYVNILPGANGCRSPVDFTGCTEYRLIMTANLVGSGQWGARIVRDSDDQVLHESANLGAAGERELDSGWQPLPAWAVAQGEVLLRAQMKSTTAADDPVVRRVIVGVR